MLSQASNHDEIDDIFLFCSLSFKPGGVGIFRDVTAILTDEFKARVSLIVWAGACLLSSYNY